MVIDGDAGFNKLISYRTAGLQRFGLYVNNTAESGANAGSDFAIRAYSDAGTLLTTPIFIKRSTGNVGIGTTAPITPLNVYNSSSSVSSVILVEQDTSATIGQINQYRKNGSVNLTSGTEIGRLSFGGYFNSTYSPFSQVCSAVIGYYGGTGTDRTGGLRLTTWNGGGATTRLQVAPDGKVSIGTTGSNAKLQIVGDGSTSATTSLLVQNSSGATALNINDDLTSTFGGAVTAGVNNGTFADIILDYGGGTRRIRPGGNSLDLTDTLGNRAFQINAGGGNPRIALEHDGVNFVRGLVNLGYTSSGSTQQMVLSATNYVGHLTPFFDIKATGYANSKNTDLRLYTDNTTSGTYGNIIIGHNGTNATGNVGVGETSPIARLQVKGSGSTSATTAFRVQNSSFTDTFFVNDDGSTFLGSGNISYGPSSGPGVGLRIALRTGWGTSYPISIGNLNTLTYGTVIGSFNQGSNVNGATIYGEANTVNNDGSIAIFGGGNISSTYYGAHLLLGFGNSSNAFSNNGQNCSILIGSGNNTNGFYGSGLIGSNLKYYDYGQLAFGGNSPNVDFATKEVYFGNGIRNENYNAPSDDGHGPNVSINVSQSYVTNNRNGGNLILRGGQGTGSGIPGNLLFSTGTTGVSGSTFHTYSERMRINGSGNVLIGTTTDIASSKLTISSTTQGFLPPRMTTAEKNAISSPANGLIVYDTDLVRPCFFNGATWITL
jgi:hypothetical protein